jgi:hypothetical protein
VFVGALLIGGAPKVQAQIAETVNANIPFQFYAGGRELPAGKYSIRTISTADNSAMEIRSADGQQAALFETEQSDISAAMKDDELIFNQVGDNYYLSQIVDADDGTGAEVSNPNYRGKQNAAQNSTGHKHVFAFLHAL